jgi:signal transduction histidine kinase
MVGLGATLTYLGAHRVSTSPRAVAGARLAFARLRFEDEVEAAFAAYWFEHSLLFTRLAIGLAVALYAAFGVLDHVVVGADWRPIWMIRAAYCLAALGVLAFTFTERFRRLMQPVLCALGAVTGLGIVVMVAIVDADKGALYYVGILLAVQWTYAVLRLRFSWATAAIGVVIAGYELVHLWHRPLSVETFLNSNFFLLSTVIIGMLAGYTIERGVRTDFVQRRLIEQQRVQLAERNQHLDSALQASLNEVRAYAEELQASRARIVASADMERRRIERNLHDGAQQHLVALAVNLRLARDVMTDDPAEAAQLLDGLAGTVKETIDEVRALAHGIYPPLLMESGLPRALSAAAARCPLAVSVDAEVDRYPSQIEASVYFCVLEALQNAAKYASGASVGVRLWEDDHALFFEVVDDGPGFDGHAAPAGHGFMNMSDRLGAIGGHVAWSSRPGRGVRIAGSVPLEPTPTSLVARRAVR